MAGFNLVRNARVFFTHNTDANTGVVADGVLTAPKTQEILVMNGFSFSQNTETQNITVSEAGLDPARGQRTFNTALAPVDFSFTTYVRPKLSGTVTADEKYLWNALLSDVEIDATGVTLSGTVVAPTRTASSSTVTFGSLVAANLSTLKVGEVVTVQGITDTANPKDWNAAAKIISSTPAADSVTGALPASATAVVVQYLNAPGGVAVAPTTATYNGTLKFFKSAITTQTAGSAHMLAHTGRSNKNSLVKFGLVVVIDAATYVIDNCSMGQASVDFGLDGIAQIAWTGQGTALRQLAATTITGTNFTAGAVGAFTSATDTANFITNKLATVTLFSNLRGISGTEYVMALTGGNLTINNNITYVTPEILGKVNQPIGYFTGTRAISGNITAYLKTGLTGDSKKQTGGLLVDMLASATTSAETKYSLSLAIGGKANATKVEVDIPGCMLQIPSIETSDVVSTTINFTAEGFDGSTSAVGGGTAAYDLEATNDLTLRYYSA